MRRSLGILLLTVLAGEGQGLAALAPPVGGPPAPPPVSVPANPFRNVAVFPPSPVAGPTVLYAYPSNGAAHINPVPGAVIARPWPGWPKVALAPSISNTNTVTLAWGPSSSGAVVGYNLQCLDLATGLETETDVATNFYVVLTNLVSGHACQFTVTAYDGFDDQSAPAGPIVYTPPVPVICTVTWPAGQCHCLLGASLPAGPWIPLATNAGPGLATFVESNAPGQQFFTCQ